MNTTPKDEAPHDVVYGQLGADRLIFIPRDRAVELAAFYRAIQHAKTWGEVKATLVPGSGELEHLVQWVQELGDADDTPQDSDEWSGPDSYPGWDDGYTRPVPQNEMLAWIPESILERYATITEAEEPEWSFAEFDTADETELIAAFSAAGFHLVRDDALVAAATDLA